MLVAIDPGDRHVGWAEFEADRPTFVGELTPQEAVERAEGWGGDVEVVVIERFKLYPDKAAAQAYSEMETSQLIGVLRYLVPASAQLVMQDAAIKVTTESYLRYRGIELLAPKLGVGGHAKDAEVHGYCYILLGKKMK